MKRTITLIAILLCAVSLFAQAPEKFSYQAVVRNASNALVIDAQVGVRVSILQGSADGSTVYVETHTAATNANGLLTMEIGGGKAEQGSFTGIDWANGPYFLKTETDPNGGSDYSVTITQQLLSVPYALYAREAANSFSGDYNDLKNKPAIPQNVGELANDAGYITMSDLPHSPKGGGTDDAGVVQTTACGEVDLCQVAAKLAQMEAKWAVLMPTVTTSAVSNVTETSATCGGNVTSAGYSAVTGRGVCLGTEPNPTVEGSHTSDGIGTGMFTSRLAGLAPNTTYYVRAYATNSIGTAYGEDVSFTTFSIPADAQSCPNTPTVTDGDGNVYSTVLIGTQCWMRQNLRTTKKADGTAIPAGGSNTSDTAPYYYNYSGSSIPLTERGYLYNWPAAMEACPVGWHLPSDAEWTQLTVYVQGQSEYVCNGDAANIAKALASTSRWSSTSAACAVGNGQESNNATGFSAVPAGRCDGSSFRSSGVVVHYWSSTEISTAVYERYLHYKSVEVSRSNSGKADGFSVRCLRDGSPVVDERSCPGISTVTDGDGNIYSTVQIGEQCWMRQNLRTTKYADGTAIPAGGSNSSNTMPYYYDYSNSDIPFLERGYLYNWTAAIAACPEGWHLPSDAEWTQLENYLNGGFVCGENSGYIAKALASEVRWNSSSVECSPGNQLMYANNATGFSAIPAGRCDGSSYRYSGSYALFWSSTAGSNSTRAWGRNLLNDEATVKRNDNSTKSYGRSVRCLRDRPDTPVDTRSCSGTPTVTDHEGNVYATVQIGQQCWMRENLRTTTSPHTGTYLVPAAETGYTYSGKQARWYNNDSATYAPMTYGLLYNWNAAVDTFNTAYGETSVNTNSSSAVSVTFGGHRRGICPEGWHLPSNAEWTAMIAYVDSVPEYQCYGSGYIAQALASTTGWYYYVECSYCDVATDPSLNNATGFSVVPAGLFYGSSFSSVGYAAGIWSATQNGSLSAYCLNLYNDDSAAYQNSGYKNYGWSVRCLRD